MIKTKKTMNNLFDKFKKQRRRPAPQEPEPTHERTIPPHIVACRVCGGKGETDGTVCPQCQGSGRVIVSHEVKTFVTAYIPSTGTFGKG